MMTKAKRVLVVIVAVLAVLTSIQLLRRRGSGNTEPYLAEVTLSDGENRFRLLKAVEGPLDYDWKDPTPELMRMLPPPIGARHVAFIPLHLDGFTMFDRFPGASFYFRPVDSRGRYTDGPSRGFFNPTIEFEESTGFIFRGRGHFPGPDHTAFGVAGLTVSALPRRDPMLKILIHEDRFKQVSPPLVMEVKNPFYQPAVPVWEGKALPQEMSVEDPAAPEGAKAILKRLTFGPDGDLSVDVRLESKAKMWHPSRRVWLEDATGNRGSRLSPFEPAWKVHVAFDPSAEVEYPEELVWRVGRWKKPADQSLVELTPPESLAGLKIESAYLAGAGCLQTVDGKKSMVPLSADLTSGFRSSSSSNSVNGKTVHTQLFESKVPFLLLQSAPVDRNFAILTRLRSGTKTLQFGTGTSTSNTVQHTHVGFERWPEDGEEWTLEVIYVKKPTVEFLVTPPDDARQTLMKPVQPS